MAVYCGMLVALVVRDPGVQKFTRCRFHESYNEHGRGRWKAAGKKGDGRRAKRLHREVRPRAVGRRATDLRSGLRHADPVHRRKNDGDDDRSYGSGGNTRSSDLRLPQDRHDKGAENAGLWTEEEIDEWNAAMAEYEALHGPIGEEK